MKKIIHVISDSNIGGAGKYLLNYLGNCNREVFEVKVVLPTGSLLKEEITLLGFDIFEIDGLAEQSYSKVAVGFLKKIFDAEKPDLVHAHACLSARIAAKKCGAKIVYTRHTDASVGKKLKNPIGRFINKIINNYLSDGIIAVSDSAYKNLVSTGISKKKIEVIYNGVQPTEILNEEEKKKVFEEFGIEYDTKIVSIVARLEEYKGHEYFIDTAKIVSERGYDAKFVIAGTGSRKLFLEEYSKNKNVDNVVFLDFVKNISDLNNITYIQVNASLYEAFGLAVVEAMRVGVPAVVISYGGNLEVVDDGVTGFIVNGQDSNEFAERIIQLINDKKLYDELSRNSIKMYNKCFTASAMTKNTEKFYSNILGGLIDENQV